MKKFFIGISGLLLFLVFCINQVHADTSAVDVTPTSSDIYEINNATPGLRKVNLGERLKGQLVIGSTTVAAAATYAAGNPAGSCASNGTAGWTTPTTKTYLKTTGAVIGESYCLGDGYIGQEWIPILATDGGQDFIITPLTKTGWTDYTLRNVNDSITFKFINPTVGWVKVIKDTAATFGSTATAACTTSQTACASVALAETSRFHSYTSHSLFGNSYILANGSVNQAVTYSLTTDGGQDIIITPTTKKNFTDIHLDDAKDNITVMYINDTTGWVITGNAGATIN